MKELLSAFTQSLQSLGVRKTDRILLAVSGGLDSIVLTRLCILSGQDFGIAHANFQLRGAESERDETFVRRLALENNKLFFTRRFDAAGYAVSQKCSVQVAARTLRYEWFDTLTGTAAAAFQYLCTAHHLDDDIETMLMHFFRGTGIRGLTGMPSKRAMIIRPLLFATRKEIRNFATRENLAWAEDSSNETDKYTRNLFRNQLIPSLEPIFPDLAENMKNNLQRYKEVNILYDQALLVHKKRLLKEVGKEIHIPILLLQKSIPLNTILFEILRTYNFTPDQTSEVVHLMTSGNGKYVLSASHRIIKNRRWLIIAALAENELSHFIIDGSRSSIAYPGGQISFQEKTAEKSGLTAGVAEMELLDADKIQFPLIFRKCRSGDYFYPLGMTKKKKLARFFIDQKLSKTAKEKVWVLVMESQIIYVVGYRIDNRFKVTASTKNLLLIRNEPRASSK